MTPPILVKELPGTKRFALFVGIVAGSAIEPDDKIGIAHLTEHMLFTTTSKYTSKELIRELEWHGIETNASTSYGVVKIYLQGPAEQFSYAVKLLNNIIKHHDYKAYEFDKEQAIVLEELKAYRNLPSEYVTGWMLEPELLINTPLQRPILGTESTVQNMTLADIKAWKEKTYIPENLVISAAGDISEQVMRETITTVFDQKTTTNTIFTLPLYTKRHYTLAQKRKGIDQAYIQRGYIVPALADEEYIAMLVLYYILDGGMSSRIFEELREKRGLGYVVGMRYLEEYGYAYMLVNGCLPNRIHEVEEGFDTIVKNVSNISVDECNGMKTLLVSRLLDKMRKEDEVAEELMDAHIYQAKHTMDHVIKTIPQITIKDIQSVIAKTLTEDYVQAQLTPD
jgi:predicted Zn-dependent peptidase